MGGCHVWVANPLVPCTCDSPFPWLGVFVSFLPNRILTSTSQPSTSDSAATHISASILQFQSTWLVVQHLYLLEGDGVCQPRRRKVRRRNSRHTVTMLTIKAQTHRGHISKATTLRRGSRIAKTSAVEERPRSQTNAEQACMLQSPSLSAT